MLEKWQTYKPYLYIAVFLLGSYVLFRYVLTYVMPFIFAGILAFVMDPLVNFLERIELGAWKLET